MINGHYYLDEEIKPIKIRKIPAGHVVILGIFHAGDTKSQGLRNDHMRCLGKICFEEKMY